MAREKHAAVLSERRLRVREQLASVLQDDGAPLVWEVGSGHGHFLTAYAIAHPDKCCIGVDIESDRVARAEKKRERARLTNLHFIRAEARLFLESLPTTTRIHETFVLFPDPWPKLRHHKHRLLQPAFLSHLAQHAAEGSALYFRTDHHPYFSAARAAVAAAPAWELVSGPWPFEHETVFQSRAERHDSLIARKRTP